MKRRHAACEIAVTHIAEARLADHEANGTRVKLREGWAGAARQHTKSVEEMAQDKAAARANAAAADKGKMTKEPA